jgi:hypothetical protein
LKRGEVKDGANRDIAVACEQPVTANAIPGDSYIRICELTPVPSLD